MKRLIIGAAALGAVCLWGCQTDTAVGGFSSEVSAPTRVAQNPDIARGDTGPLIRGTVVADYRDTLIVRDDKGFERAMRVDEQTLYKDREGDLVAREYLAPGAPFWISSALALGTLAFAAGLAPPVQAEAAPAPAAPTSEPAESAGAG
jgi:hypothetical protein